MTASGSSRAWLPVAAVGVTLVLWASGVRGHPAPRRLRAAGKSERQRLLAFLDDHAGEMPRTMLTYAMEHLDPAQRAHYRSLT